MVPVRSLMPAIVWDVEVVRLPGALVVGQVSPFDQVMDITVFVQAVGNRQDSSSNLGDMSAWIDSCTCHRGLNSRRIANNLTRKQPRWHVVVFNGRVTPTSTFKHR